MEQIDQSSGQEFLSVDDQSLLGQCEIDLFRSHGPGGQKRNKTSSAVRLRHRPTGLIVTAVEERSQHVNKARALRRLREAIALHVRRELDINGYARSRLLTEYLTPQGQIQINARNCSYALIVAEVLDVLHACGVRVGDAAERIGLSTAHLVQFIQRDPKIWERVNQMRAKAGEKPLR